MFWKLFKTRIGNVLGLFNGHFVEAKAFYAIEFNSISSVTFIGDIDTGQAFAYIDESLRMEIKRVYQHSYFDHTDRKMYFNNTVFVLSNQRMVELGNNWCQVLHKPSQQGWANNVIEQLATFKTKNTEPAIGFARQTSVN